ncbi:hypothetical protein GCM10028822_29280 [Hymenobacter terrigena]
MALNPEKLSFLLRELSSASYNTVSGIVSQIFGYLNTEIKDNPLFDKYEAESAKWVDWPQGDEASFNRGQWSLPTNFEESKSLAYYMYKRIAEGGSREVDQLGYRLFRKNNMGDNAREFNRTFLGYFTQALEDIVNANPEVTAEKPKATPGTTAFIIHGHDNELKTEVLLLLKRAGVNAIVLHEQADRGRTIIDKLVGESEVAGYAIALLTPDDITESGRSRARQNVILEIGYFLGRIGKERLRMLVKEEVEIPSDLQGILYEKHDAGGAWKIKLLKEIQAVGIYVDIQAAVSSF